MAGTTAPTQSGPMIRTPDQRLRVFVSSTLRELAEERHAAREAITRLRLSPVLFELGARPYPPRTLYRAYLEQSQVFVGIYWQQYGWIAPDMDISGLEDEYRLSVGKPRLLYIREPAPDREARLSAFLDQIRREGLASYKPFRSPGELQTLIEEDLALLLSERFDGPATTGRPVAEHSRPSAAAVPVPASRFVGREQEIRALLALLESQDGRLVTLTGPGGIGKTRLALKVAGELEGRFRDGVCVAVLDSVTAPAMVLPALVQALGLHESSEQTSLEILKGYLREREMLFVLDNFEHVIGAAPLVMELLESCARLHILVTSREVLRVSGEHQFEVPPLPVPERPQGPPAVIGKSEAVRLFVDRARAVREDFELDESTALIVAEIVRRLEGLPLAIELAAARIRLLPPAAILQRLTSRLQLLTRGPRDLPERQQTLRNTIDWSYGLLEEDEKALLARLSVFVGGWTLEAVEVVCAPFEGMDLEEALSSLIDKSLARPDGFAGDEPRFRMLEIVREYALERLSDRDEIDHRRDLHAEFFFALAKKAAPETATAPQEQWLERLAAESGNFRAAMRWLLDRGAPGRAAHMGSALWNCWWLRSRLPEAVSWMAEVLAAPDALSAEERALAATLFGLSASGLGDYARGLLNLRQAYELYRDLGDRLGVAGVLAALGGTIAVTEDPAGGERMVREALATFRELQGRGGFVGSSALADPLFFSYTTWGLTQALIMQGRGGEAVPLLEEAAAWAKESADKMALSVTVVHLGMARLDAGDVLGARSALIEALELARDLDHHTRTRASLQRDTNSAAALAYALEALAALAVATADHEKGVLLLGAAQGVRRSVGMATWAPYRYMNERTERTLRGALGDDAFASKVSEGTKISLDEVLKLAAALG
jgi:predicted ATPase